MTAAITVKCTLALLVDQLDLALQRMMDKPKELRPFVIVTAPDEVQFVQFAGSQGEPLVIDIPQSGIFTVPVPDGSTRKAAVTCRDYFLEILHYSKYDARAFVITEQNTERVRPEDLPN